MVPVNDDPVDARGAAEQLACCDDVAVGDQSPDAGRGPAALVTDIGDRSDLETSVGTQLDEGLDGSAVAHPEAGVGSDDDELRVQGVDEHRVDELCRRLASEFAGELQHEHRVQPRGGEQVQPLGERGELGGCAIGEEHRDRMRVEGDRHRGQASGGRSVDDNAKDRAMAPVHAVEIAEGDNARADARRHLVETVPDLHGGHSRSPRWGTRRASAPEAWSDQGRQAGDRRE